MAEQGFTKYIMDFAGEIKKYGPDITRTTAEIEQLFKDALLNFLDPENLQKVMDSSLTALDALQEKLYLGELTDLQELEKKVNDIIKSIEESIGIDLNKKLDPSKILESITELIPDVDSPDVGIPDDLKNIYRTINNFFTQIPMEDVRISVKRVTQPVPERSEGSTLTSSTRSNVGGLSNARSGSPGMTPLPPPPPESESTVDTLIQQLLTLLPTTDDAFTGLLEKLQKEIIESGLFSELEAKREAFLTSVTGKDFSIKKVISETTKLLIDLIEVAIRAIKTLILTIKNDLLSVMDFTVSILNAGPGFLLNGILEELGLDIKTPTLLTLPALIIATPLTVLSNIVIDQKPVFPNIFSVGELSTAASNASYGLVQIVKGIIPVYSYFISEWIDRVVAENNPAPHGADPEAIKRWEVNMKKEKDEKTFYYLDFGTGIAGAMLDLMGQIFSAPSDTTQSDEERFQDGYFGQVVWDYQWAMNFTWPLVEVGLKTLFFIEEQTNIIAAGRGEADNAEPENSKIEKFQSIMDYVFPVFNFTREAIHLALFIALLDKEKEAIDDIKAADFSSEKGDDLATPTDARIQATYILDPLPALFNGFFSLVNFFLERNIKDDKKKAKTTIKQRVFGINNIADRLSQRPPRSLSQIQSAWTQKTNEIERIKPGLGRVYEFRYTEWIKPLHFKLIENQQPDEQIILSEPFDEYEIKTTHFARRVAAWEEYLTNLRSDYKDAYTARRSKFQIKLFLEDLLKYAGPENTPGYNDVAEGKTHQLLKKFFEDLPPDGLEHWEKIQGQINLGITRINEIKKQKAIYNQTDSLHDKSTKKQAITKIKKINSGLGLAFQFIYGMLWMSTWFDPKTEIEKIDFDPKPDENTGKYTAPTTLTIKATFNNVPETGTSAPKFMLFTPKNTDRPEEYVMTQASNDKKIFTCTYTIASDNEAGTYKYYIRAKGKDKVLRENLIFSGIKEFTV